jgi:hypothetical protein
MGTGQRASSVNVEEEEQGERIYLQQWSLTSFLKNMKKKLRFLTLYERLVVVSFHDMHCVYTNFSQILFYLKSKVKDGPVLI